MLLTREALRRHVRDYLGIPADRALATASPLRARDGELAGLRAALVVTAEADVVRDDVER